MIREIRNIWQDRDRQRPHRLRAPLARIGGPLALPPGSLHVTWLGDSFALWIDDPTAGSRDLRQLATGMLGPDIRTSIGDHFEEHDLRAGEVEVPYASTTMIPVDPRALTSVLVRARPTAT